MAKSDQEQIKRVMERIKKNDPVAMTQMGRRHHRKGEYGKASEYWAKTTELGDVEAHACLGGLYYKGNGIEKDEKKAVYHFEQAAIGGEPNARVLLANYEMKNGRFERARKHLIIAANLGCDISVKAVKSFFIKGIVSKEDYAAALRGYQSAVNETKSAEREKAEAYRRKSISQPFG
jgi:TPR repeat protein